VILELVLIVVGLPTVLGVYLAHAFRRRSVGRDELYPSTGLGSLPTTALSGRWPERRDENDSRLWMVAVGLRCRPHAKL